MSFAVVALLVALVGFVRPSLVRIPDRMAAIWLLAVSFGCYLGGAALLSPPEGDSVASDAAPVAEETVAATPAAPDNRTFEERMAEA